MIYKPKPLVWLIHGAFDFGGVATTDRLRPFFEAESYPVEEFDYGFTGLLGVRFLNGRRAKELAGKVEAGSVGVGHSNGCAILYQACKDYKAPFSQLVFINPALDADVIWPAQLSRVFVLYSPHDYPVKIAGLFYKHPWGDMGNRGAVTTDPRIININKEKCEVKSYTHLDMFLPEKLDYFGRGIVELLS